MAQTRTMDDIREDIAKLETKHQKADEKFQAALEEKRALAKQIEDLELEWEAARIAGNGLSPELMDKLAQRVENVGAIESQESVNGG